MYGETNRISDSIMLVTERISGLDADALARVEAAATLDFDEWFTFGDWPSRASMAGIVTLDEAMTLHAIHTDFQGTASLAERVVFMQIMGEIGPRIMGVVG